MAVDVKAEVVIKRSRDEVAAFAMKPDNDPVWISGITEARMLTEPPVGQGTQVERIAYFMGKRIEYVLEVADYDPNARLAMRSIKGPFPMKVDYEFEESGEGHWRGYESGAKRAGSTSWPVRCSPGASNGTSPTTSRL